MRPRLTSFELAWTDAAFDALYPDVRQDAASDAPSLPHGIRQLHPAKFFDDVLADIPLEQSIGLRLALWIVALAPLFVLKRVATIASLREEQRGTVLERLLASRSYVVRQLTTSLKAIATMIYASSPTVVAAMNVPRRDGRRVALAPRLVPLRLSKSTGTEGGSHEHAAE